MDGGREPPPFAVMIRFRNSHLYGIITSDIFVGRNPYKIIRKIPLKS